MVINNLKYSKKNIIILNDTFLKMIYSNYDLFKEGLSFLIKGIYISTYSE